MLRPVCLRTRGWYSVEVSRTLAGSQAGDAVAPVPWQRSSLGRSNAPPPDFVICTSPIVICAVSNCGPTYALCPTSPIVICTRPYLGYALVQADSSSDSAHASTDHTPGKWFPNTSAPASANRGLASQTLNPFLCRAPKWFCGGGGGSEGSRQGGKGYAAVRIPRAEADFVPSTK